MRDSSLKNIDHIKLPVDTLRLAEGEKEIVIYHGSAFKIYPYNKKRVQAVTAGNIVGYGAIMAGLYSTWYSKYPQSKFLFCCNKSSFFLVVHSKVK